MTKAELIREPTGFNLPNGLPRALQSAGDPVAGYSQPGEDEEHPWQPVLLAGHLLLDLGLVRIG